MIEDRHSPRPGFRHAVRIGTCSLLALAALSVPARAGEDDYRLAAEDHVRLKVFEWRASQDAIFEWKAMNDEFVVEAGGVLPVPFAGDIAVEGRTPKDVARLIAERLVSRMKLAQAPDVSVNIVKYRPYYVAGDVTRPGPYPFQPGVTVLQAVATAGGTPRPADMGIVRLSRDVITGEGELASLSHDYSALLVRRSRLQAELNGADTVPLPQNLEARKADPLVVRLMRDEAQIFTARRQALLTQTAALNDLKAFLVKESDSLREQSGTLDTQMSLVNKELVGVSSLVEKGMAVAPRQLALQRTVAQIQGDRLNMQTGVLRVQAEIGRANIALVELRNGRSTEVSLELRDTQLKLDEISNQSNTRRQLLYEAQVAAPKLIAGQLKRALIAPSYSLVRVVDGATTEVPTTDTAELAPGDTVRVSLPLPDAMAEDGDLSTLAGAGSARASTN